jgi:hypothetical protein
LLRDGTHAGRVVYHTCFKLLGPRCPSALPCSSSAGSGSSGVCGGLLSLLLFVWCLQGFQPKCCCITGSLTAGCSAVCTLDSSQHGNTIHSCQHPAAASRASPSSNSSSSHRSRQQQQARLCPREPRAASAAAFVATAAEELPSSHTSPGWCCWSSSG